MRAEVLKSSQDMINLNIRGMVHSTIKCGILNVRTSKAPNTNEFRLSKLENKVQTYLALSHT